MLFDLHNDLLTACLPEDMPKTLADYSADGLTDAVFAVWTTELSPSDRSLSLFVLPRTDIRLRLGIEDLGSVYPGTESGLRELLFRIMPAYVSLTWNGENIFAGGCGRETPLTDKGERAIELIADCGAALDLAHLSDTAFAGALAKAKSCGCRVLCSHTASRALCDQPRCATDGMAESIAEAGGMIGVMAVPNFLCPGLRYGENCGREKYAEHIAHFCAVVGSEHVAIGTDFFGSAYYPRGMERYSDFGYLAEDLAAAGLTEKDIENIFYKTAADFFAAGSDK